MADKKPPAGEQERKLHKRERRLKQRLQDAQAACVKAQQRLSQAQTRLSKRQARLQSLEARLALVQQQLTALSHSQARPGAAAVTGQEVEQAMTGEASEFARMAREVAETTERAARAAMERATDVASRLEQMSAERGFLQGLQSEAEKTRAEAQEAAQVVEGRWVDEACSAEIEAEEEAVAAATLTSGEVDISPATPSSARTEMQ